MIESGEFLKCECGKNLFKVSVLKPSTLIFTCECGRFQKLDYKPDVGQIGRDVAAGLSDYALNKLADFFSGGSRNA